MKYLKKFESIKDELKSKNIDVVLIPSGEILSVNKDKLLLIFENDPEFEVDWNEDIGKYVTIDENKKELLELLEYNWYD